MFAVYETTLRLNCRFRKLDPCVSTEEPPNARSAKSAGCAQKARKLRLRDRYQRANSRECPGYFCAPDVTSETALAGWGGRTRTSESRNQNPSGLHYLSMRVPKNRGNSASMSSKG